MVSVKEMSNWLCEYLLPRQVRHRSNNSPPSAILSDITTPANRAKALAHVGIAFAICFCIGPPIGAYFASRPLPSSISPLGVELNIYATPAFLTLVLLLLETVFLFVALPETRGKRAESTQSTDSAQPQNNGTTPSEKGSSGSATAVEMADDSETESNVRERIETLQDLRQMVQSFGFNHSPVISSRNCVLLSNSSEHCLFLIPTLPIRQQVRFRIR